MTRRVAIIGAGIGAQHVDGFAALPGRFTVATICDLDGARGKALASAAGAAFTTDMRQVLDDPGIDIVDVCLPPHLHLDACEAALGAGKVVICEKPLVASLAECDRLEAASRAAGQPVFPVFQYRFGTGSAQLRALIAAGLAGRPVAGSLETHWNRDAAYYAVPWRGTWAGERGGCVLGHAIHIHDLVSWLMGPPVQVQAALGNPVHDIETEDSAALTFRLEGGALVTSSVTLGGADDHSRLRLVFEGVTVTSDTEAYAPARAPWRFVARDPVAQEAVDAVLAGVGPVPAGYAGLFGAVADALDGEPSDAVTLADGRRSLELVTAIYHADRTARAVDLPPGPGHPLYHTWLPEDAR
ncbi:Gfo/Idh/MocA family protein [Pseudaestuariivita atlantica]|uniref:Oxidoreductase n=1 Tax=Pseudaestuariivita atlantica TaxID=1317121 RepID=A0A0L1JNE4_9RHOB|nr:Gfo/Idh/MocA family oxidoreductase [Pseudaestuariivita atlantica]KNG93274.1 oxidoreductase [Pseudaestuariivita atlantica]